MRLTVLLSTTAILAALGAEGAAAADLALKRVMLSSAGVGYFEYAAEVDGPAVLGLDVPLSQVDDVLKSLVVFDDAGGVGEVELPGLDQSHSAFGDVPFGPQALASPLAFLNSLQGVEVTVQGPRPMTGRIMQAETVHEPGGRDGATHDRTRVSVLTVEGLKQFLLEDSDAVQVADPGLRERIARALAALRQQSGQDARHISIRSTGTGHRTVRVAYVAVAPLWKASYRLVLPPPDADPAVAKARLQGWATLENASGADWAGVGLTLQYGNPVTFHQAIYRSYFVQRPEVPVTVLGRLLPDVDRRARLMAEEAPPPPPPAPIMAPGAMPAQGLMRGAAASPAPMAMAPPAQPAATQEGTEETVFTIPNPVNLAAGHSASVPILDREVPALRLGLARQGEANPVASIRLRNTTAESFPAGVLTLYDGQGAAPYAGDARLGGLPAGETRLLPYAQDLRTGLDWKTSTAVTLAAITAAQGVLTVDERNRTITRVTVTGPAREPRRVLLEVPKPGDATVAPDFARPVEETATAWRFAAEVKPGETKEVAFAVDRLRRQSISLLNDPAALTRVLNLQGASDATRAALLRVADLRSQEAARIAERDLLVAQRRDVERDEERLRSNLSAVQGGDALRSRLMRQLEADETRIAQIDGQIETAGQAVNRARQALLEAINGLKF